MGAARGSWRQRTWRLLVTLYFMLAMLCSLLISSRPLFVSVADVVSLLFLTMAGCSSCLFSVSDWKAYSFRSSLIDVPLLSLIRSCAIICTYGLCACETSYSPYVAVTGICGAASAIFLTVKAATFRIDDALSPSVREMQQALPLLLALSLAFGFAHIFVALKTRHHAKRKLLFRWEDVEAGIAKEHTRSSPKRSMIKLAKILEGGSHLKKDNQLPASLLADVDSLFMDCGHIVVHYKLVEGQGGQNHLTWSPVSSPVLGISVHSSPFNYPVEQVLNGCQEVLGDHPNDRNAVVLIHGFGGGAFSWRHVMNPLARQSRSTVVAFDRPGWGLTSRPGRSEWERRGAPNPYDIQSQVDLLFTFCERLGLTSLVLVGHDDGGLLALMAAAKASKPDSKVAVKGVVLVGVSLSREVVPAFARVLLRTSLGRQMLRPLLRTQIGQVANRRAWHDASKLTSDILELYKTPQRVQGWDQAFAEVTKSAGILQSSLVAEVLQTLSNLPALLVAGLQDMLVPLKAAENLATKLPQSKLVAIPGCGHLPPEECPGALLAIMLPFISGLFNEQDPL